MFQCTVNDLIIFHRGVWICADVGRYEVCYCGGVKVRGACVPGCMGVVVHVSVFNVFNLTTSFYVAELV